MNFRRWITALAVLALFAGLASAQVAVSTAGTGSFQCQANVAVPPVLRAEGLTELIGDIVLTCSGGAPPSIGAVATTQTALPTANITVSLQANVTSRLLSFAAQYPTLATSNTSEALLMIDEPGSGLSVGPPGPGGPVAGPAGWGPQALQVLCGASGIPYSLVGAGTSTGCPEYAQYWNGDFVMSSTAVVPANGTAPAAGYNVFAGVAQSNQVTFYGIPILPPASAGVARIFRITNVRLNASALSSGGLAGTQSVMASVSISGPTSVLVTNPTPIVGFIQQGMKGSLQNSINTGSGSAMSLNQCSSYSAGGSGNGIVLRYSELFGTAFKTRVAPTGTGAGLTGQGNTIQNIPGSIYQSESGFVTSLISGTQYGTSAGLADYGTRLKAVFNNVPANVTIYVSTTNIYNLFTSVGSYGAVPSSGVSYAQLVLTENGAEGNLVSPTGWVTNSTGVTNVIGYAPATMVTAGQYEAVWEVINTQPSTVENFDFGVWVAWTANPAAGSPATTGSSPATVTLSYAPTSTQGAFTASAGALASASLTIPRFSDTLDPPINLLAIVPCTTNLLFPFVTSQAGFDTGIAIMNTGSDPWGTSTQQGTCTFNFYGNNQVVPFTTPVIAPGQGNLTAPAGNWAFQASNLAPKFEGYMIAVCNFQFAHGYAFISDTGAQLLAHGYLALILPNGTSKRSVTALSTANGEALEN